MATQTLTINEIATSDFPATEVKYRLQAELQKIADQSSVIRPEWEPLLDSKRVVGTVLVLESLFPFKIPPDRIVQKGGYNSVDEAIDDMLDRIKKIWIERRRPEGRR